MLPVQPAAPARPAPGRFNLLRLSWLRPLLIRREPQLLLRAFTLAGFAFTILAGLFGSPVGSHNFAIIFVWIAWWSALKLVFIPLGGKSWCSVCPIPLPGEWLQTGGLLQKSRRRIGLSRRWPVRLRGGWLQAGAFLVIGLFSAVTLTDPRLTAWVLLALFGLAFALSLVFENRSFCSHLCPIGGFSGLYARTAPVELRVIDSAVCAAHTEKTCYQACPWGLYPLALKDSAQCGLCMECLRACPSDNLAVNLRPFGADLTTFPLAGAAPPPRAAKSPAGLRLDETFLALVMLGSALAFAAVFTGPWGWLKSAAFAIGTTKWALYALAFLALNLLLLPGAFGLAAWLGERLSGGHAFRAPLPLRGRLPLRGAEMRRSIARQSPALLPLGLFAWIAFTVSFALPKLTTVLTVLSDPFGWGWDLFGTAHTAWFPDFSGFSSLIQMALLLLGLFWSARLVVQNTDAPAGRGNSSVYAPIPVALFSLAYTLILFWLLVG